MEVDLRATDDTLIKLLKGLAAISQHCMPSSTAAAGTAMQKLRIVILRFGTARQKLVLE
jgi:hypothetical protein